MNIGFFLLVAFLVLLVMVAVHQKADPEPILQRFCHQFFNLVPRMLCALIAAGFIAELIPKSSIAALMGGQAGLWAIPVAAVAGLLIPGGPVIAFAIAAIFARSGASTAALVTFITSWSIFAMHRIVIYELPMLGASFLRLRLASSLILPFVAGLIASFAGLAFTFGAANPMH